MTAVDRRTVLAAGLALAAAPAFGCAPPPIEAAAEAPALAGTTWVATAIGEVRVPDGTYVSLEFGEDGAVRGTSGCNVYTAEFRQSGASLAVGEVIATKRGCTDDLAGVEAALFAALPDLAEIVTEPDGRVAAFVTRGGTRIAARPRILR